MKQINLLAFLCLLLTSIVSAQTPTLVRDLLPGPEGSTPENLFDYNGQVLFTATTDELGRELYISDGTQAGTRLVADINTSGPGTASNSSNPGGFTAFNGLVYFRATTAETGTELWVTDGTTAGTRLFRDFNPGTNDAAITDLIVFNGRLYFTANDGASGSELWSTDGTNGGTERVFDINPGAGDANPEFLTIVGERLIFSATGPSGTEAYVTDGTAAGTTLLSDLNPGGDSSPENFFAYDNDRVFFQADNGTSGRELFLANLRTGEVTLFADLGSGNEGSNPTNIFRVNMNVFWTADVDGVDGELVTAPVDNPGAVELFPINSEGPDNIRDLITIVDNELVAFIGDADNSESAREIYLLDGLFGPPILDTLSQLTPLETTNAEDLIWTGTDLYYTYETPETGRELAGVDIVVFDLPLEIEEIAPGPAGAAIDELTLVGNQLFFAADNGTTGLELFSITASTGYVTPTAENGDVVQTGDTLDLGDIPIGIADSVVVEFVNTGTNPTRFVIGSRFTDTPGASVSYENIPQDEILNVDPDNGFVLYTITPQGEGEFVDSIQARFYTAEGPSNVTFFIRGNAVEATPVLNVDEAGTAITDGDTLFFTGLEAGASLTRTVTVSNTGTAPLTVNAALSNDSDNFTAELDETTVAPGESVDIDVTFFDEDATSGRGRLLISTNAGGITIQLVGEYVVVPDPMFEVGTQGTVFANGDVLQFDEVLVDTDSTRTIVIRNTGEVDIELNDIILAEGIAFATQAATGTITPAGSVEIAVVFSPTETGVQADVLTIVTDAGQFVVNLNGTGVAAPVPAFEVGEGQVVLTSGDVLDFSNVIVNTNSTRTIVFRNTGETDIEVTSITLADGTVFTTDAAPATTGTGDSIAIAITYSPLEVGTQTDVLTIATDAGEFTVNLNGTSIAASVADFEIGEGEIVLTSGDVLDFSNVIVNTDSTRTLVFRNTGDLDIEITSVILASGTVFTADAAPAATSTGDSVAIAITYSPVEAGTQTDVLTIATDAGNFTINLNGTSVAAPVAAFEVKEGDELLASGDLLDFSSVPVNADSSRTVVFRNTGDLDIEITAITLSDGTVFTATADPTATSTGDSVAIVITYSPVEIGTQTDVLTITTDAGEFTVLLNGSSITNSTVERGITATAVYPNPTQGRFTVELAQPLQEATFRVYSLTGEVVASGVWPNGVTRHEIDLSAFAAGVYQLEVQSGTQRLTASVVRR